MTRYAHMFDARHSLALADGDLDAAIGGTSQFIAKVVAAALNAIDPNAHCVAADHKVACDYPPKAPQPK